MMAYNRCVGGEVPGEERRVEGHKTARRFGRQASKECYRCSMTRPGQSEADRRHQVLPSSRKRSEPEIHLVYWRHSLEACVEIGGLDLRQNCLQIQVRHPPQQVGYSCGCVRHSC